MPRRSLRAAAASRSADTLASPGRSNGRGGWRAWWAVPIDITSIEWVGWHRLARGTTMGCVLIGMALVALRWGADGYQLQVAQAWWAGGLGAWLTERIAILLFGVPRHRSALAPWGPFGSLPGTVGLAACVVFIGPLGINFAGAVEGLASWRWIMVIPGLFCTLPLALLILHPRAAWRATRGLRGALPPLWWRVTTRVFRTVTFQWLWGPLVRR